MTTYTAPMKDILFNLYEIACLKEVASLPGYEEATPDFVEAVVDEAGKFASRVLAPINASGDKEGAKWDNGNVVTPSGFKEAYRQFVGGGWSVIGCDPEFGGQIVPKVITAAITEMMKAANLSFSLCTMLTIGASEAIGLVGTHEQKQTFLPKLIDGTWTGTMNLTEPQAGSDLAAVRTKAVKQDDGTYKLFGQKIFITYGEHDFTENIIHTVLARTPNAPEGVKGISMFIVPKFLVNTDGSLGERNDIHCVSIEHKLGIHASPTCVLAYGDRGGAVGYLLGEENRGLEYMFIMMNAARFSVGLEGLAMAEIAYQKALAYAKERVQGRDIASGKNGVTIIHHPDVRRMLMLMKSQIEAMRALAYFVAGASDRAAHHPDAAERKRNQAVVDLLIPVVKGWLTETGVQVTSLGIQVHGGMGFIEETGAAQFLRDARITTIYEGTTGIQANDLVWRKIVKEGGNALRETIGEMQQFIQQSDFIKKSGSFDDDFAAMHKSLTAGVQALTDAAMFIGSSAMSNNLNAVSAGAGPFLELFGVVAGGWQLARGAVAAREKILAGENDPFYPAKISTARFFADHVLSRASSLSYVVCNGASGTMALSEEMF
jgi:acyl-CoA dehydrogenase